MVKLLSLDLVAQNISSHSRMKENAGAALRVEKENRPEKVMMNKKTVQVLAILILATGVRAETVALDGNRAPGSSHQEPVQLNDQMIAPWAWKNVKEAVDGVVKQADLTVNYSDLNSIQMDSLSTRNVVLESRKPLHWKVLLSEVLRGLEFDFIQNDAGVVEIMPFDRFHAYKTEEAERDLQNNHALVEVNFNRMPLLQAIKELTDQAKVSLNTGYLPLEIRDPDAAAKAVATPAADAKTPAAPPPPVKVYETSFKTVTPLEWRNVLKNILDPDGYDFVEMGGAVCPMDKSKAAAMNASLLAAKPLIRQVVPLYYATPTDIMARIMELGVLSPRGKLSLTQSVGQNTTSGGGLALRPRVREDLVVSDVEANVLLASEWIRKLDVSDGQVMIQAHILSINDSDIKNLGVAWSGFDNASLLKLTGTESWGQNYLNGHRNPVAGATGGDVIGSATAVLGPVALTSTLHALNELENTEVLSHPLVVLGNRTEGKIELVTDLPYYTSTITDVPAGTTTTPRTTTSWVSDAKSGLTLWISPEISPDGKHVRLSVNQQMDDLDGFILGPSGSTTLGDKKPQITKRKLDTRAMVRDGDTLVIGGLVKTSRTVTDSKVPFLGSIPLLGRLFSYKDNKVVKNNLVIMITPTILNEDTPATGYEPKSEAKAKELSALGKDYLYNKPENGLSAEAKKAKEEGQPEVSGVEPKSEAVDQPANQQPLTQQLAPESRDPDVKEIFQTLEAGGSGGGQKTEVSDQKAK